MNRRSVLVSNMPWTMLVAVLTLTQPIDSTIFALRVFPDRYTLFTPPFSVR